MYMYLSMYKYVWEGMQRNDKILLGWWNWENVYKFFLYILFYDFLS